MRGDDLAGPGLARRAAASSRRLLRAARRGVASEGQHGPGGRAWRLTASLAIAAAGLGATALVLPDISRLLVCAAGLVSVAALLSRSDVAAAAVCAALYVEIPVLSYADSRGLVAPLGFAAVVSALGSRDRGRTLPIAVWAGTVYCLLCSVRALEYPGGLAGMMVDPSHRMSAWAYWRTAGQAACLLASAAWIDSERGLSLLVCSLAVLLAALCTWGIFGLAAGSPRPFPWTDAFSWTPMFAPGHASGLIHVQRWGIVGSAGLCLLQLAVSFAPRWRRSVSSGTFLLGACGIVVSGSRQLLLAALACLILAMALHRQWKRALAAASIALLALGIGLAHPRTAYGDCTAWERLLALRDDRNQGRTVDAGRGAMWAESSALIRQSPWLGNASRLSPATFAYLITPHNGYLAIAGLHGLPMLLYFCLLAGAFLRMSSRRAWRTAADPGSCGAVMCAVVIAGALVSYLGGGSVVDEKLFFWFGVAASVSQMPLASRAVAQYGRSSRAALPGARADGARPACPVAKGRSH